MNNHTQKIVSLLEKNTSGDQRPSAIFEDWLDIVTACLEALPAQMKQARKDKTLGEDTPETKALFERLREKYQGKQYWDRFANAFAELLESSDEYHDTIGDVYMEFGYPSKQGGQFFTPFHVAKVMASQTMMGIERIVYDRIKEAAKDDPLAQALLMAGMVLEGDEAFQWFINRVVPSVADKFEPIKVNDPACGSGVMFLAAASECPRWMLDMGLIRFCGSDIDATCVKMAQINMMLYGLNGYSIKLLDAVYGDVGEVVEFAKVALIEPTARVAKASQLSMEI